MDELGYGYKDILQKASNMLFWGTVFTALVATLLDLLLLIDSIYSHSFSLNVCSLIIYLAVVYFYLRRLFTAKLSLAIILSVVIVNSQLSLFLDSDFADTSKLVWRESLFMVLLISLATIAVHRLFAICLLVFYFISIVLFAFYVDDQFLQKDLILHFIAYLIFFFFMDWIAVYFRKKLSELEIQNTILKLSHAESNMENHELLEIYHRICQGYELVTAQNSALSKENDELAAQIESITKAGVVRDKLFEIVANDLQTPVGSVQNITKQLSDKFYQLSDTKKKHYLNLATETVASLYGLLNNMVLWTRMQLGTVHVAPIDFNLKGVVAQNIFLLKEQSSRKDLHVMDNTESGLFVHGDPNLISEALYNLLANAIQFNKDGGSIRIHGERKGMFYYLSIVDTGIGISAAQLNSLFFEEKESTGGVLRKRYIKGLGVLIAKEFIQKSYGRLTCKSKQGAGSVFTIELPVAKEQL